MISSVMTNLRAFKRHSRLKDALQTFIATQLTNSKDAMVLQEVFRTLDVDADGRISKRDLAQELSKTMDLQTCEEEAENIITQVATNDYIVYTQFLRAGLDPSKLLSKKNLELAFAMIDADGSGKISGEELKTVLSHGSTVDEGVWEELIDEADRNGDGEIDLAEFKQVLLQRL